MTCSAESVVNAFSELVKGTCYHRDSLKVEVTQVPSGATVTYYPHMADLPLLIGKQGRQSKAYRFLADAIGKTTGAKVVIEFLESYVGNSDPYRPFEPSSNNDLAAFKRLFDPLAEMVFGRVPNYSVALRRSATDNTEVVLETEQRDSDIVAALRDVFHPWSFRNGHKIRIKNRPL